MGKIKALQTSYNGYSFRSRLEARWAVFFDALGVEYEYEPEGYDLGDGISYLPDFKVKCYGVLGHNEADYIYPQDHQDVFDLFIEVKGEMDYESSIKIKRFDKPLLILGNIPNVTSVHDLRDYELFKCYEDMNGVLYPFNLLTVCDNYYSAFPCADEKGHFFLNSENNNYYNSKHDERLLNAYMAAKQARFEHGESGYGGI